MVVKLSEFLNTSFSTYTENDAFNTSVVYPITLTHTSTGTPGNGIGTGLRFITETSAGNNEIGGLLDVVATDVTSTSEDFDFVFKTMAAGNAATESLRISSIGNLSVAGDLTVNGGQVILTATSTRDKYRVWTSSEYAIGMQNSVTFGAINNDYAMTFQMSNTANRGFWWGDTAHTVAQGAMALSTDGKLSVAHSLRLGYGESDTTTPGIGVVLDVNGSITATNIDFGNVDIGSVTGFDSWKYNGNNFDLTSETSNPGGIFVDSTGFRAYVVALDLPSVYRYSFQIVNRIDTLLYLELLDTSSEDTQLTSVFLKSDGTELYITGLENTSIYQYTLSTPYLLSSATYTRTRSVSTVDTIPVGLFFKPDGTKMYLLGQQNSDVYQYNLSTAWNISTATYLQNLNLSNLAKTPTAIAFSDDGLELYISDSKYDSILKFTLNTAWDISTAVYTDQVDIGDASGISLTNPKGIAISETAERLYIVCADNAKAFELDLASPAAKVSGNRFIVDTDSHVKNDLVVYQDTRLHKNLEVNGATILHDSLSVNSTITTSVAETNTTASHYYVEIASDGAIRPKTLENVRAEIVTTDAVNIVAATTVGTITSGTWNGDVISETYGGTGLSSLGSGVATFLGTPSSNNLRSAISDETGSGVLVFATSPTFTTTIDGGATFGAFASSTALTLGYNSTASSTTNLSTGAVASGFTKTINIGTGGAAGSTTTINIGDADGGSTIVNSPSLIVPGNLSVGQNILATTGPILTLGTLVGGGTGYMNGTHTNQSLTGGTGAYMLGTVVVASGVVTGITLTWGGHRYTAADVLTVGSLSTTLATTTAGGNGTTATISFAAQAAAPFQVGSQIIVAGVTPAGYNGTFTVTACTTTSVSYANTTITSQTVAGTVKMGTALTSSTIPVATIQGSDIYVSSAISDAIGARIRLESNDTSTAVGQEYGAIVFGSRDASAQGSGDVGLIRGVAVNTSGGSEIQLWTAENGTAPNISAVITSGGNFRMYNATGTFYSELSNSPTANRTVAIPDVAGTVLVAQAAAAAGYFDTSATTPTGTTRLNYGGYLYPTFLNLLGSTETATAATHYFVETGSDGFVRPKTLANVRTEIVTNTAVNDAGAVMNTGNESISGIKTFSNGTASTTNTTGSVVITGGLGVSGAINAGADVTAFAASDSRLKTNIENITDALSKVNQLNGVTYNWNDLAHEVEHKDTTVREVGVIAQQVNSVLPEVITIRDNGYMAVRYEKMIPLLIEAIKELILQNRQLTQRLSDLEKK
jgi:hypothetical protein